MTTTFYSIITATCLMTSALAHADCGPQFSKHYAGAERIVDSLRPDKPGQIRVIAFDGSEYTAGQVLWMKGQLRSALQACTQGNEATAKSALQGVTDLLNLHHSAQ